MHDPVCVCPLVAQLTRSVACNLHAALRATCMQHSAHQPTHQRIIKGCVRQVKCRLLACKLHVVRVHADKNSTFTNVHAGQGPYAMAAGVLHWHCVLCCGGVHAVTCLRGYMQPTLQEPRVHDRTCRLCKHQVEAGNALHHTHVLKSKQRPCLMSRGTDTRPRARLAVV
jgi:hypothetical protein